MEKRSVFAVLAGLILSTSAFATGDAGCGLGSVIFQKNALLSQLFAGTTNASFGSQTFGMTTGTSNCKVSGLVQVQKEQIFYAEANYHHLVDEMAKGSGENLSAFAQVLGCKDSVVPAFGQMTRAKYETIYPSLNTTPQQMLETVKKEIKSDPTLAKSC